MMKLLACVLALLPLPSVLYAQVSLSIPRLQRPAVRAMLGPIGVVATLSGQGVTLRATPAPAGHSLPVRAGAPVAAGASSARVLATARRYLGTRYRYGGETPKEGFDCSGFVQYVFGRNGIALPRSSREQASAGRPLPLDTGSLRTGDLLLFASTGTRINHVALYIGNNRILHSSSGAGRVVYDDLSTPRGQWYLQRHVASRRVLL